MATFFYKATNTSGKLETGQLEVSSKQQALERLERMGLFPLLVTDQQNRKKEIQIKKIRLEDFLPSKRISGNLVLDFTDKLATLLRAGLPLARALTLLIETTSHEAMQDVIRQILKDVKAGKTFAVALSAHPKVFERLYINMVKAGEAAGVLEQVLDNIREFLEARQKTRQFLVSALIYPIILAGTGLATVAVLVFFVLPSFQDIFDQIGQDMPFITRILVDGTTFLTQYKWILLILTVGSFFGFRHWSNTVKGRLQWDTYKLKMPLFGKLITQVEVNRFSNTMGILLRSSVSLLEAMSISKEIAKNVVFQKAMDPIVKGIKKGDGISQPMSQTGIFPKMAVQLIIVGEETGTLGDMFTKIARIYHTTIEQTINRILAMFQPAMTFVMFIVVGFIVAAMLMAVTSLSTASF